MPFYLSMNEKDFQSSRLGKLVWEYKGMYHRFEPNKLPITYSPGNEIVNDCVRTALVLGRLDGLTNRLSSEAIHLLRIPFMMKEAKLSSEIEGTRTTLTEVYRGEKVKETNMEKALDNEEIINYAKALERGLDMIGDEISEHTIMEIHRILLQGVRGCEKDPGKYKRYQNAIGRRLDTLETVKFVPASPETTPWLMKNLIEYLNSDAGLNPLIKIATAHYQFEVIHPFRDGNGRLGRLLIMVMMCTEKILKYPLLYISEFFNRNRETYTELLYRVSSKNMLDEWFHFFLKALEIQAHASIKLILELEKYKQNLQEKMEQVSRSPNMNKVIDQLFVNPYITIKEVADRLEMSIPGASGLVHKLEEMDELVEITGKQTRKLFVARNILMIIDS